MRLLDANILIYAVNSDSPHHRKARRWLEGILSDVDPVGFTWPVLIAFLRVTTRPGLLEKPLAPERAIAYVDSWLRQPCAELVTPGEGHWAILRSFLLSSGTAGNLSSDAHLAAIAIEQGWTLCSTDHDFRRFAGLPVLNPLL